MRLAAAAFAAGITMLGASPVRADSRAEAIVLFDQGIKDMKAGRLDKACPELQASLDLVKDSGTKGALARCHGLSGRVASAWLLWRELSDTAPKAALRSDAAAQAQKLEPRLPRYTLRAAGKTPDLVVQINGRSVRTDVPVAVPIDPGKVTITATGRNTETWTRDYTAVEGETLDIEIPVLAPRAAVVVKPAAGTTSGSADGDAVAARRHRRHVIALAIGAVALGAAGAGTYFGLDARSEYDEAKRLCGGKIKPCPEDQLAGSQRHVDDARSAATISTALFGAAGAAAVLSVIVWATAPSLEQAGVAVAPTAGNGSVGLVLGGAF